MDELIEMLGFWIDRSGATAVLREVDGGCHPATRIELALWDALEAAREDAERYRWLRAQNVIAVTSHDQSVEYQRDDLDAAIDQARGKEDSNG